MQVYIIINDSRLTLIFLAKKNIARTAPSGLPSPANSIQDGSSPDYAGGLTTSSSNTNNRKNGQQSYYNRGRSNRPRNMRTNSKNGQYQHQNGYNEMSPRTNSYNRSPRYNNVQYNDMMMQPIQPTYFYPAPVAVDVQVIKMHLLVQLEYYFSLENLIRDIYFRRHMDAEGYIPLTFIAGFNRVRSITLDLDLVREVILRLSIPSIFAQ
jgi:la-related protein 1